MSLLPYSNYPNYAFHVEERSCIFFCQIYWVSGVTYYRLCLYMVSVPPTVSQLMIITCLNQRLCSCSHSQHIHHDYHNNIDHIYCKTKIIKLYYMNMNFLLPLIVQTRNLCILMVYLCMCVEQLKPGCLVP